MSTQQPTGSRFEFVVMASARAKQLLQGCQPRVAAGSKTARIAVHEVKSRALWTEREESEQNS